MVEGNFVVSQIPSQGRTWEVQKSKSKWVGKLDTNTGTVGECQICFYMEQDGSCCHVLINLNIHMNSLFYFSTKENSDLQKDICLNKLLPLHFPLCMYISWNAVLTKSNSGSAWAKLESKKNSKKFFFKILCHQIMCQRCQIINNVHRPLFSFFSCWLFCGCPCPSCSVPLQEAWPLATGATRVEALSPPHPLSTPARATCGLEAVLASLVSHGLRWQRQATFCSHQTLHPDNSRQTENTQKSSYRSHWCAKPYICKEYFQAWTLLLKIYVSGIFFVISSLQNSGLKGPLLPHLSGR